MGQHFVLQHPCGDFAVSAFWNRGKYRRVRFRLHKANAKMVSFRSLEASLYLFTVSFSYFRVDHGPRTKQADTGSGVFSSD